MQFEQLRLERFGHFADKVLDLGGERIHLIHGPNASGKSTIRTAISDLIFGIDDRTTYAFRFEKNQLRLGALIATRDGTRRLDFVRSKRRTRSLSRPDGTELQDDALLPFLGAMDRRTFGDLYVLDQDALRLGGEHILSADGDIGRSLFAASSGFANLAAVREALEQELDGIAHVGRKLKSTRLWQLEATYNEARARQKTASLRRNEWDQAKKAFADAEARIGALSDDRRKIERQRSALDRKQRVLLVLPRLDRLRSTEETLANAPDLPKDFAGRWQKAAARLQSATDAEERAVEEQRRLKSERQALPSDAGPLIAHTVAIEDLYQRVANIADQQHAKLKLGRDILQHTERLRELLLELGIASEVDLEEVLAAIPTRSACAAIEALIAERGKIDAAIEAANKRKDRAHKGLEGDQERLAKLGKLHDPADAELEWKTSAGFGNVTRAARNATRQVEETTKAEEAALTRLAPWIGTVEKLLRTAFPSFEVVTATAATLRELADEKRQAEAELRKENASLREIDDDLRPLTAAGTIPSAEALGIARGTRDASWAVVREAAGVGRVEESKLAEHERLVTRADELVDQHVTHRELPTLLRNRARTQSSIDQCNVEIERVQDAQTRKWAEWQKLWERTGWEKVAIGDPEVMKSWLARVKEVSAAADARRLAEAAASDVREDERLARAALLRASGLIGATVDSALPSDQLASSVEKVLKTARVAWEEERRLRASIAEREAELEQAKTEIDARKVEFEACLHRWTEGMRGIRQDTNAEPSATRLVLSLWATIREEHSKRSVAERRLDGVIKDLEEHEAAARALIAKLDDLIVTNLGLGQEWSKWPSVLFEGLKRARQIAASIEASDKASSAADRAHVRAVEMLTVAKSESDQLRTEAGVGADADVLELIDQSDHKYRTRQQLTEAEQELLQAGDEIPEIELRSEVVEANVDVIRAEIADLAQKAMMLDEPVKQASADRLAAEQHIRLLEARTGFATAAMEANGIAEEVKALAQRWTRLRAAQILLDRTVEQYRKSNEGPLLQRANNIFADIVRDRLPDDFTGLEVDYEDPDRPSIVGRRRDGTSCAVKRMSTGTRDQLWLSLRIAALERRARDVEPMPFLADDLFDSSDEARTVAMLRAIAELAQHTQVLLFTHHAHVVDIAVNVLGKQLHVHRLDSAVVAGVAS